MITKAKGYGAWQRQEAVDSVSAEPAEFSRLLAYLHRTAAAPSCTGPCDQGRRPCPSPVACRVMHDDEHESADAANDDGLDAARGIVAAVAISAAIIGVTALAVALWP